MWKSGRRYRGKKVELAKLNAILLRLKPHFVKPWLEGYATLKEVELLGKHGYTFQHSFEEMQKHFNARDKEYFELNRQYGFHASPDWQGQYKITTKPPEPVSEE